MAVKRNRKYYLSFDAIIGGFSGLAILGILIYFTVVYSKNEHCGKLKDLSLAYIIICWVGYGLQCIGFCFIALMSLPSK